MNITVIYFAFFEDLVGQKKETIILDNDNLCMEDLINHLSEKYGPKFQDTLINSRTKQLKEGCVLLLNDMKGNLDHRVRDGDVISLLPMLAGG